MNIDQICDWLNDTYPSRDWNQQCQRLVWNVVWKLSGISEGNMNTYPTATAARLASNIVSTDADAAPSGAIHYWRNPAEGHVGVSLGGGKVLMTGTAYALGEGGVQKGNNYGITTVSAYTNRMGNPYLGWAHTNGSNPNIQGKITGSGGSGSGGKELRVKHYHRVHNKVRDIKKAERLFLTDAKGAKQNCVGEVGEYSFVAHLYGDGFAEGDVLELRYDWYNVKTKTTSPHYIHRVIADRHGMIRENAPFARAVRSGEAVYLSVYAGSANKKTGKVALLGSDALQFVAA